jgi:hypothetical protein
MISANPFDRVFLCEDADLACEEFQRSLGTIMDACTYTEKLSSKKRMVKPWMTPGILAAIRQRDRLYKRRLSSTSDAKMYKLYRAKIRELVEKAKDLFADQALAAASGDPRKQWEVLNELLGRTKRKTPVDVSKFAKSAQEVVDDFNSYFSTVGEQLASEFSSDPTSHLPEHRACRFSLKPVCDAEVRKAILGMKSHKAPGLDKLSSDVVKKHCDIFAPVVRHITNLCFSTGIFPKCLKTAVVIPVFKSGDPAQYGNYRPISLLCIVGKLIESLSHDMLVTYCLQNKILNPGQFGFVGGQGTENAIERVLERVYISKNDHECVSTIFLDYRKAFDTISHQRMLAKLECYGVKGTPLDFFKSYISERSQITKVGDVVSGASPVSWGVPQGSVLGPLLFILYVNDILDLKLHGQLTLFADDTALVNRAQDIETLTRLMNKDLRTLTQWLSTNFLSLNIAKSKYMLFGDYETSQHNIQVHCASCLPIFWNQCSCPKLERVHEYKYLGLIIDDNLRWHAHINLVLSKLRTACAYLYQLRRRSKIILRKLYFAFAQAVLQYCIIFWGSAYNTRLARLLVVQKRLVRLVMHAPYLAPTRELFIQSDILSLHKLYVYKMITHNFKYRRAADDTQRRRTRAAVSGALNLPNIRIDLYKRSFCVRTVKVHNKFNYLYSGSVMSFVTLKYQVRKLLHSKNVEEIAVD